MKIKIVNNVKGEVEVPGLGLVKSNVIVNISEKQAKRFKDITGQPLEESFEVVETESKKKKEEAD